MKFEKELKTEGSFGITQAASRRRFHLDPQIAAELIPIILGGIVSISALAASFVYWSIGSTPASDDASLTGVVLLTCVLTYLVARRGALHDRILRGEEAAHVFENSLSVVIAFWALVATLVLVGVLHQYNYGFLFTWAGLSVVATSAVMKAFSAYFRWLNGDGRMVRRIAVYGSGPRTYEVAQWRAMNRLGSSVTALFDENVVGNDTAGNDNASGKSGALIEDLLCQTRDGQIDCIVIALPSGEAEKIAELITKLSAYPVDIEIISDVPHVPRPIEGVATHGKLLSFKVQRQPLGAHQRLAKTILDFTLTSVLVILLAPLMALIALAIKLDSSGPVLFIQPRGGYRQKPFRVFKFRSMTTMETGQAVVQARRNDPRVTRVGAFLRRTSLDELPQLFNVLRGELSLVGPRPHALAHDHYYSTIVEHYADRLKMKPGITGWAQINGLRSETSDAELMRKRVQFDLYYIEHWSLWLDLKILLRTVNVVLFDKNAY